MSQSKDEIKADMLGKVGTEDGVTDWVLVDQQRIQDFADATLVLLAEQLEAHDVLTLDRRGFSAYRTPSGRAFRNVLDS